MEKEKVVMQLTSGRSSRDRDFLITGSMGNAGEPHDHVNHKYQVATGIDRGNGYQGYSAVGYYLKQERTPQSAKQKIIDLCKKEGLRYE